MMHRTLFSLILFGWLLFSCCNAAISSNLTKLFIKGRFKVGINWIGNYDYSQFDYIAMWIGQPHSKNSSKTDFDPLREGAFLSKCLSSHKPPVFLSQLIVFEARAVLGLQDCDVASPKTLCTHGAQFIRDNRKRLIARYNHQAQQIAKKIGHDTLCVWLMEPDF
jgi:hypothetical protein